VPLHASSPPLLRLVIRRCSINLPPPCIRRATKLKLSGARFHRHGAPSTFGHQHVKPYMQEA
jgi:hypothetical protein